MYCDSSGDGVVLFCNNEVCELSYHEGVDMLPSVLVRMVDTYRPDILCYRCGPGSFTLLRVTSVAINLVMQYYSMLESVALDKLSLYRMWYAAGWITMQGYTWIGQKKNMLLYNNECNVSQIMPMQDIGLYAGKEKCGVYRYEPHGAMHNDDIWYRDTSISYIPLLIQPQGDGLVISHGLQTYMYTWQERCTHGERTQCVVPQYIVAPSVTIQQA